MKRKIYAGKILCFAMLFFFTAAAGVFAAGKKESGGTITLAAAASLKNVFEQKLIPQFTKRFNIKVEGVYDSSGRLQTQIEQGLAADVFMSAALTQMDALTGKGLIDKASVIPLLQNKLVLIKTKGTKTVVTGFQNIQAAKTIALGDSASVPAGQYAKEAFTKLGNWNEINNSGKVSLGTNVTEVLGWVAAGSAETGVVYATDAASNKNVEVIAVLPDKVLANPVVYPVGISSKSENREQAEALVKYLRSEEAMSAFKEYGFERN